MHYRKIGIPIVYMQYTFGTAVPHDTLGNMIHRQEGQRRWSIVSTIVGHRSNLNVFDAMLILNICYADNNHLRCLKVIVMIAREILISPLPTRLRIFAHITAPVLKYDGVDQGGTQTGQVYYRGPVPSQAIAFMVLKLNKFSRNIGHLFASLQAVTGCSYIRTTETNLHDIVCCVKARYDAK